MKTSTGKLNPLISLRQTKLHRPRPSRYLVVRHRLWERLDKGMSHSLILVSAPAGYGKTTLISSWIENMQTGGKQQSTVMPAAWLALDKNDSDCVSFLEYLIGALRTIYEGACAKTLDIILSPSRPSMRVITTSLINDIDQLPGNCILVLDDYQTIQGQAVHDLLDELLQHSSPLLHLVLISRVDPPLTLARLRANDMLTEIRSRDLRFVKEETTAYLHETLDITLSDSVLTQLEERLEGWIAGLRLVTLSLHTVGDANATLVNLAGADINITDYLADEVLAYQLPAIQSFLLKTSILDRFSISLCEAVVGEGDPAWSVATCIDWLERMELFIIPLDDRRQWYRYHHLFQDLLKHRLRTGSGEETEKVLHQRASAWFEKQGMLDEAIQHARESGNLEMVARLMEKGLKGVLNREDHPALEQWLRQLPEEYLQSRPSLLMIKVWSLGISWRLGATMKTLQRVEELLEAGEATLDVDTRQILRGQITVFHAQDAFFSNQPARAFEWCREGLVLLPESWTYARGLLMAYMGLSMQAVGQSQAAERLLFDQYDSHGDKTDGFAMRLLLPLSFNHLTNGRLEQSRQIANIMIEQAARGKLPVQAAWGHYLIGQVKYQWDELDAAEVHLAEVVENRFIVTPITAQQASTVLARLHQARGRTSEAMQTLEKLAQYDLEWNGYETSETLSLQARLSLMQGKKDDAFRWAVSFNLPPPEVPLLWLEIPHATRAQILIARGKKGDLKAALSLLDSLYEMADRTFNTRFKIEILALRAMALEALDEERKADAELKQALDLAQPGGFIRVFLDLGQPLQVILKRLDKRNPNNEYTQRLLTAFVEEQRKKIISNNQFPGAPDSGQNPSSAHVLLTAREMDVLMLLREPLSTKEIASKLYLSPSTVKRHTINLYSKLGVHSRREAVATAIDLGFLPPK